MTYDEPGREKVARPPRPVAVGIAEDDPASQRILSTARRMEIDVVEGGAVGGRSSVGDVVLPPDAPEWMVEAALLRALEPRHVLFLCVANSARSQLAEGIARHLAEHAPRGRGVRPRSDEGAGRGIRGTRTGRVRPVRISSAGSEPTSVRPQAVAVLEEIGIDITEQCSKGVDDIEGPVDAVITLCAEEVCPVWLGDALGLHWGLPDPAAVEGSEEE
ncbi:MAG: arsenate reductase ArsC, partial [Gemmatimonadetes bacterium]|nr:arsenate reductase ArsC [Gemmatimonadota bacterium]NIR79353.1 arsenate reductase ArsC [Gemmatimonadota bacterium]NIU31866.1 arsenate reductase ArsC [Gemmatimonadota bacterium]NIV62228.1 hypothetical protein [Gemmatimonadota bacterium]NIW64948.1 hypothetical protein [Gemmatimonadota bacterium]